ncbi:MAG: acid phosphatase [Usitatibacter sp.]
MRFAASAAALATLALLAACGGGGGGGSPGGGATPPAAATSGVVIGSYFRNAVVCFDANGNGACDPGESSARTDSSGAFSLPGAATAVVAEIGLDATRFDPATGTASPVAARIVLRAPRLAPGVVSYFSTAVVSEMETAGSSQDDAARRIAALLGVPAEKVLSDFNKETDPAAKAVLAAASSDGIERIQLALAGAKPGEDTRKLLAAASGTLDRIANVVVVYLENHSFDNLYGLFPGANGIANASGSSAARQQVDRDGITVLPSLPGVWSAGALQAPAWAFVATLPNQPFRIDAPPGSASLATTPPDLVHRFYNNQMQIGGGRNDSFVAWSDAGGLAMGYYDGSSMKLWQLAKQYALADNFYQGAFGGSFLNHLWLVCACTPAWSNPPASRISSVDPSGTALSVAASSPRSALAGAPAYVADRNVTPRLADGNYYAVNTTQPPYQPSGTPPTPGGDARLADPAGNGSDAAVPLPALTSRTIGDALSAKNVDWRWYAGGWNQALADRTAIYNGATPNFQAHHQPFNYFKRFDPTTAAGAAERAAHLRDYADFAADIASGRLPPVAFYKPQGNLNQHPGYADVATGDAHVADVIARLQAGPQWKGMLVIVTYDENGGFWDHVAPPTGDRWGPGTRVPATVISPYAKKGYVDSVRYDTTSIAKLLARRFGLEPLAGARRETGDLSNSLDMSQSP